MSRSGDAISYREWLPNFVVVIKDDEYLGRMAVLQSKVSEVSTGSVIHGVMRLCHAHQIYRLLLSHIYPSCPISTLER